MRHSIRADGA